MATGPAGQILAGHEDELRVGSCAKEATAIFNRASAF
jgi:hypothetical protein